MEAKQIQQLRTFEKIVENKIIELYGTFLSEDKKNDLLNHSVIPDDFEKTFTSPANIQGEVMRMVLGHMFEHIVCSKNIDFSDGSKPSIPYGDYLKDSLVAYFSKELAEKYNITIDELPDLIDKLNFAEQIKETLQGNFYPLILSCDANAIMSAVNNPELTKTLDKEAVKKYIQTLNQAKKLSDDKDIVKSVEGKGKVFPPIYANGVQYIKYIDEKNQIHMIKTSNENKVSQAYKEMISELLPGEELDAEKFFQVLKKHGENIPLFGEADINQSKLSSKESDMLNTIYSDESLMSKSDPQTTLHNSDMDVHVSGDTVAITDQNNSDAVTSQEFAEEESTALETSPNEVNKQRLISEEEYLELCNKAVNGHALSDEELMLLDYYDRHTFGDNKEATQVLQGDNVQIDLVEPVQAQVEEVPQNFEEQLQEEGPVMQLTQKKPKSTSGFAQKFLPAFIVLITIVIGIIVGIAIFKVKEMF